MTSSTLINPLYVTKENLTEVSFRRSATISVTFLLLRVFLCLSSSSSGEKPAIRRKKNHSLSKNMRIISVKMSESYPVLISDSMKHNITMNSLNTTITICNVVYRIVSRQGSVQFIYEVTILSKFCMTLINTVTIYLLCNVSLFD